VEVSTGDPMVSLYSPDLLTAQEELLQAIVTEEELQQSSIPIMRETASKTVTAAKEKLRLWGLTEKQIEEIETRGKTSDHVTIYIPVLNRAKFMQIPAPGEVAVFITPFQGIPEDLAQNG